MGHLHVRHLLEHSLPISSHSFSTVLILCTTLLLFAHHSHCEMSNNQNQIYTPEQLHQQQMRLHEQRMQEHHQRMQQQNHQPAFSYAGPNGAFSVAGDVGSASINNQHGHGSATYSPHGGFQGTFTPHQQQSSQSSQSSQSYSPPQQHQHQVAQQGAYQGSYQGAGTHSSQSSSFQSESHSTSSSTFTGPNGELVRCVVTDGVVSINGQEVYRFPPGTSVSTSNMNGHLYVNGVHLYPRD